MMRLPVFEYHAPKSVAEAVQLKKRYGARSMYVAGGTDLYPKMKRRQLEPEVLIGLSQIEELNAVANGRGLRIGAGLSLTAVANLPPVLADYPALARAASFVSSPPLRNAGTIGGNLCVDTRCTYYDQTFAWRKALGFCLKKDGDICWVARSSPKCLAVSSSDCAPVAIALDATVRLTGPEGTRDIPAAALYRDDGMHYLTKSDDEIMVSVYLPPRRGWCVSYLKLRRRGAIDFPILGVAAAVQLDEAGVCHDARLVLGAVSSWPVVVEAGVLQPLIGQKLTPALVKDVSARAYRPAKPMDNTDMDLSYRKKMARVFIERALSEAAGLTPQG